MGLFPARSSFTEDFSAPVEELVRGLRLRLLPGRPPDTSPCEGYAGVVGEDRFTIRRLGHPVRWETARPEVNFRGEMRRVPGGTRVAVVVRHGRLVAALSALLLVLLGLGFVTAPGGQPTTGDAHPGGIGRVVGRVILVLAGGEPTASKVHPAEVRVLSGILFGLAGCLHVRLWWDDCRVRREVRALLNSLRQPDAR